MNKFDPLLSLEQLAGLLDRSTDGLRLSLSHDGEMANKFNPARKKIGRRVYFKSALVAQVLDEVRISEHRDRLFIVDPKNQTVI